MIIRDTIGTDRNYPTSGVISVSDFLIYGALSKTNKYKHLKPFLDSLGNNVSNGIGGMQIRIFLTNFTSFEKSWSNREKKHQFF